MISWLELSGYMRRDVNGLTNDMVHEVTVTQCGTKHDSRDMTVREREREREGCERKRGRV